jgi:tetrahydromethanopterin S-methyltransferase subunit B
MGIGLFMVANPLAGVFKGAGGQIGSVLTKFAYGFVILAVVGVIAYFIYKTFKDKALYITPVTLTELTANGMEKSRYDLKGGIFWNKGIRDFKVKAPKKAKAFILGYIPDFSKSNATDGRLHFITYGDKTIWQQVQSGWSLKKEGIDAEGNKFAYNLIQEPIPRETKQVTINSIKNWRDTVEKSKLTAFGIAIGAFLIMVIAHLISLFIQTKVKCGT